MYKQARYNEPLLREIGKIESCRPNDDEIISQHVPQRIIRKTLTMPKLSEVELMRHYLKLSQMNYGVDIGIYPLGSCTMKYNPKICEKVAKLEKFLNAHPCQDERCVQGILKIMHFLQQYLCEISGMDACTLQPAAGAHGEFTGLLLMKAYFEDINEERNEIMVPDTAHGTNPASAVMAGFKVIEIPSTENGCLDIKSIKENINDKTAGIMLTNPNTLGIFENEILEVAEIFHNNGSLLYYDGANLNAIMGICRPGDMKFDLVHFNLHKTFGTPHGGGGPGAGPVGVKKKIEPYLPVPTVEYNGKMYYFDYDRPKSIGKIRCFYGNFLVLLKAFVYIKLMGDEGLKKAAEMAVLNSNYMKSVLMKHLDMPFKSLRKHEFVVSGKRLKDKNVKTLDLAKGILDHGMHAPTIYFPLLVEDAIMIEPTESEPLEEMDKFIDAVLKSIEMSEKLKKCPRNTSAGRVNELKAAKDMILSWRMIK